MALPPLLRLDHVGLTFGGSPLLVDVDLSVGVGEKIALVGRNGSGKSTLLKMAAGLVEPSNGVVFRQPGATIRYLPQLPDFQGFATVSAYIEAGLRPTDDRARIHYLTHHLQIEGQALPHTLSGGEARRVALARVLAPMPDVLLLDEPTNHLDITVIEWLEGELARMRSSLVVISHDRRFLDTVSRATIWLDRGISRRLEKNFSSFESWRDKILKEEEQAQHQLSRQIEREEHWLRYGVTARRKRNVRRLQALQNLRQRQRDHQAPLGNVVMEQTRAQDSGQLVIEAKSIAKSYGERALLRDFSIRIKRGDRIGFVGANGVGKTTLLSILTGKLAPDSGVVRFGVGLMSAYLDQKRDLDETQTLDSYLTDGRGDSVVVNGVEKHVASYLKDFLFLPEQLRTPIRALSGGERARLMLARLLTRPANLLILDEPTNDLDMETLDLLQELVSNFTGTVLLVSHDRDFLDRTVSFIVVPEGDGKWGHYAGGYSDMLLQRKEMESKAKRSPPKTVKREEQVPLKPKKNRLSFKQQYALDNLPKEMKLLGKKITVIEERLADPQLYLSNRGEFETLLQQLETLKIALVTCENEWLELELLREEMTSQ